MSLANLLENILLKTIETVTKNFNENDLDVKLLMETQKKDFFLKWSKDIYEKRSNTKFTNELDAFKDSLKNKNVNGFTVLPSNHREYLEIKWTIYYIDNNNNPKKIDGVSYGNNVRRINNEYISNYHSMVINDETFLFFDPLGHKSKPNVHVFLNPNNGVINEMVPEITLKNGKKFKKKIGFHTRENFSGSYSGTLKDVDDESISKLTFNSVEKKTINKKDLPDNYDDMIQFIENGKFFMDIKTSFKLYVIYTIINNYCNWETKVEKKIKNKNEKLTNSFYTEYNNFKSKHRNQIKSKSMEYFKTLYVNSVKEYFE